MSPDFKVVMAQELSPAFQFYFKDWRSSKKVSRMSFKERGMYLEMLIDQWDQGPLPLEPTAIAQMIGAKDTDFLKSWPTLRDCFERTPDGWVNRRLETERVKQATRRQKASEWGKEGAKRKWAPQGGEDGHPIGSPSRPDSFSLSLASSSAIASALASEREGSARVPSEEDAAKRAGRLLERYAELYTQHRHGAKLRLVPSPAQFQEATDLVARWPDARLEKLAILVLTTDDPFITGTDRSFKIFAMKASWADNRLAQWEAERKGA